MATRVATRPIAGFSPRFGVLLAGAVALVVAVPRVSDVRMQRLYEMGDILPFEHPVLARVLYVALRTVVDSPTGIAIAAAVVGAAAAFAVAVLLRRAGADVAVWTAAPTLVLVGQNVDAITCIFIVLGIASWQRSRAATSGAWLGLGAAFKVSPALLVPALAASAPWRRRLLVIGGGAVAWALTNVPFAVADYDAWVFPYRFARLRDDLIGTVWAALPFGVDDVNALSSVVLVAGMAAISYAVLRRRVTAVTGVVLTVALFLLTNKVWQPHYVLWLLAVLAFTAAPRRPVRLLELANLGYFAAYWVDASDTARAPWIWLTAAARIAALVWVCWSVVRADRTTGAEP